MFVYVMYDKFDNVLYVGKTKDLGYRMAQHFSKNKEEWKDDVNIIKYMDCKTEVDMSIYEIYLINKLNPKYNASLLYSGDSRLKLDYNLTTYKLQNNNELLIQEEKEIWKDNLIILDEHKINTNYYNRKEMGYPLSYNWCKTHKENLNQVGNNMRNYFMNIIQVNHKNVAWSFHSDFKFSLGDSIIKRYNSRYNINYIIDDVSDINTLAYLSDNIVMKNNKLDEKLSLIDLIGFIKRSAISNEEKVNIYIPSERLRNCLKRYLNDLGGDK